MTNQERIDEIEAKIADLEHILWITEEIIHAGIYNDKRMDRCMDDRDELEHEIELLKDVMETLK